MNRRIGLAVALIATLNAFAWGLITPAFNVPDETAHVFYAQYLGETGKLPIPSSKIDWYSEDEGFALSRTTFYYVIGTTANRPPADAATRAAIRRDAQANLDRVGTGNASTASNNPPLFYLPYAAVYRVTHGLGFFDRLAFMRILSALFGGLTVLCIFSFLREVLPGAPLAATVGALVAGLLPQFAFITSGVNNDVGLYLAAAALFLTVSRLLRRGLTVRRAAAVGAVLGAGVLVKTQMLAFAPAVGLALLLAIRRARGGGLRPLAAAAGAAAAPLALYGVLGATLWNRPIFDRVGAVAATPQTTVGGKLPTIRGQLSYLWQEYLPRLPFMQDMIPGFAAWRIWFRGVVGRFGWLDYGYPNWIYPLALVLVLAVTAGAVWYLWQRRQALRPYVGEAAVYALAAFGLLVAIAIVSYRSTVTAGGQFEQARYLLPLLALFALVPALAVRAAGRRAPVAGVLLVLITVGFSVFAQALTLARFYG